MENIDLVGGLGTVPTQHLSQLNRLSLAKNSIREVPHGWFKYLHSLRTISLEHNKISDLPPEVFIGGPGLALQELNLNHNKLRQVPTNAMYALNKLLTLKLSHNRIKKIRPFSFNGTRDLTSLDLSFNHIKNFSHRALYGLESLRRIDVCNNQLITLDDRTFYWKNMTGRQVFLSDNPWVCNCMLTWIKRQHRKRTPLSQAIADIRAMQCDRPLAFAKKPLIRIRLVDFTCDHQYYTYYFSYEEDEDDWDNGDGDEGEDYDEEDYKEHSDDYYENHSDDESYDTRPKNRKKDKKNKHEEDPVFNDLY